jgi:hypothetical protein
MKADIKSESSDKRLNEVNRRDVGDPVDVHDGAEHQGRQHQSGHAEGQGRIGGRSRFALVDNYLLRYFA